MTTCLLQRPLSRRAVVFGAVSTAALACLAPATYAQTATPQSGASSLAPFLTASAIHDISIAFDQAAYDEMIRIYVESGEKEWIEGTVTIDGTTYDQVGLRLKGNSSLMGMRASTMGGATSVAATPPPMGPGGDTADDMPTGGTYAVRGTIGGETNAATPERLPWLIKLNEFVSGQEHDGMKQLVIRSNHTATSLNEAVALDLLQEAGLASQQAAYVRLRANDSEPALRLAIEHPQNPWMEAHFGAGGLLYKAEATGSYSYRGDDPAEYVDVFDIEAGDTGDDHADLTPLFGFLDFINNADDETFATELEKHLDVEAFATYLAMMKLIRNDDDINGPGNNSYLHVGPDGEYFTVVPWDMNLAFRGLGGGNGMHEFPGRNGDPVPEIRRLPDLPVDGGTPVVIIPAEDQVPGTVYRRGGPGGNNILVQRTSALDDFVTMLADTRTELAHQLYTGGLAESILTRWSDLLLKEAGDLVTSTTLAAETDEIRQQFTNPQD